jgi:predicted  nucleic acid-binding Zn-ribbon protein
MGAELAQEFADLVGDQIVADYRLLKSQIDDVMRQITTSKAALKAEQTSQRELAKLSRSTTPANQTRTVASEPMVELVGPL